jgi:hypothetical protein
MKQSFKKNYMNINVILTFDRPSGKYEDIQEVFDIKLPISKKDDDKNAVLFIHNKLFERIKSKIKLLNRNEGELIKISTCGDWNQYEKVTSSPSLPDQGHPCKWFFGEYREDLDIWEKKIVSEYGFGKKAKKDALDIWEQSIVGKNE